MRKYPRRIQDAATTSLRGASICLVDAWRRRLKGCRNLLTSPRTRSSPQPFLILSSVRRTSSGTFASRDRTLGIKVGQRHTYTHICTDTLRVMYPRPSIKCGRQPSNNVVASGSPARRARRYGVEPANSSGTLWETLSMRSCGVGVDC